MLLATSLLSRASDGVCPDSIIVFRHNDLEIEFFIENAETDLSVIWDFGNGETIEAGSTVVHVFDEGVFNVTATFLDEDCAGDSLTIATRVEISACWLSLSYVALKEGYYTFTAEGYPEKYPMFWEMGDGSFIVETWVVDHQYDPGTYEVCAYIISDFCYVDTLEACVTFTYEITDDIVEKNKVDDMFFPNPSHGLIYFNCDPSLVEIFGMDGGLVLSKSSPSRQLDLNHLPSGIYSIRLKNESGIEINKFLCLTK